MEITSKFLGKHQQNMCFLEFSPLWYTVEPHYCAHFVDLVKCLVYIEKCPYFRGKLRRHIRDTAKYRGVLISSTRYSLLTPH